MGVKMVVTRQRITKRQKRWRRHAREWRQGTQWSRLVHLSGPCDICDAIFQVNLPRNLIAEYAARQELQMH